MITAVHTLLYSEDADATRRFLRDVLGWNHIDAGDGWLIFGTGPSEMGVHPATGDDWTAPHPHEISLICDDIEATVAELTAKGAEFSGEITDRGFGLTISLKVPGSQDILVYEPRHPLAHS